MTAPTPQPGILGIAPYRAGSDTVAGVDRIIKLSSNEAALGPSPRAIAAYRDAAANLHRYPDSDGFALRRALAARHGIEAERIVCGNGSDELISLLTSAYCGVGDEVLYSRHGFLMYPLAAKACGATPVTAPETDYRADVDALLSAVTERTRILFLANPNNPTGTYLPSNEVRRLRENLRDDVLLVIDAAYAELVARNDYSPGIELVAESDNTVMTRTFSKVYGLAGLRVGWAYCPAGIAEIINRIRGPFNVNGAAQAAALAALEDVGHTDMACRHNEVWLPWFAAELAKLGLETVPSVGNFLLIRFPDEEGRNASAADAFLTKRGILLRDMVAYGLGDCLRATIGTEDELRAVVAALAEFMGRT